MDIVSILYPRRCPVCEEVLKYNKGKICDLCKSKLCFITEPRCKKCGKQIEKFDEEYCFDCRNKKHYYKKGIALLMHTDIVRKSIYSIKYNNKREYVDFFVEELIRRYKDEIKLWACSLIIPVPLHKKKKKTRGFNQAEVIASRLSRGVGIPMDNKTLLRVKNTKPQKEFNDVGRKKNLIDAFVVKKDRVEKDIEKFKKIILIDDIYTTGSTIDECAKVLLNTGIEEVYYISLSIGKGY